MKWTHHTEFIYPYLYIYICAYAKIIIKEEAVMSLRGYGGTGEVGFVKKESRSFINTMLI